MASSLGRISRPGIRSPGARSAARGCIKSTMPRKEVGQVTTRHGPILAAVLHEKTRQGRLNKAVLIPIGVMVKESAHRLQERFGHLGSQTHRAFRRTTTVPFGRPHQPLSRKRPPHFSTAGPHRQIDRRRRSDRWSHAETTAAAECFRGLGCRPGGSGDDDNLSSRCQALCAVCFPSRGKTGLKQRRWMGKTRGKHVRPWGIPGDG